MVMMLPPSSISGAAARASATSEYTLTSWAMRKPSRDGGDEFAFQFFGRGKGDAVHQHMQLAVTLLELDEQPVDGRIVGYIAHEAFRARQGSDQIPGFQFQTFVLIGDRQFRARLMQSLRDRPRDRALVGDSEDHRNSTFEAG